MAGPKGPSDNRRKRRGQRGDLSDADRTLWREAMRDVTPLRLAAESPGESGDARSETSGAPSRRPKDPRGSGQAGVGTRRRLAEQPLPRPDQNAAAARPEASEPSFAEALEASMTPQGGRAQKTLAKRKAAAGAPVKRPARASLPPPPPPSYSDLRSSLSDPRPPRPVGLDRRSADRLRRGRMEIEARIDLHGMTQAAAQPALEAFLAGAQRRGLRCVLVITGKGGGKGERREQPFEREAPGVLRRVVPLWLAEPPNKVRVLALAPARIQHGGGGALYILLRRLRD